MRPVEFVCVFVEMDAAEGSKSAVGVLLTPVHVTLYVWGHYFWKNGRRMDRPEQSSKQAGIRSATVKTVEEKGKSFKHRARAPVRKGPRHARRPALSREVLEKASEIADRSGLNQKDAIRVALGKTTVQQVLKEMMFRDKVEALIRRHGMERSTACNVIRGSLDLDTAVLLQGIRECRAWNPERSVLTELTRQGGQGVFFVHGRSPFRASVTGVEKYDCWLAEPDREPEQLEKHAILMACRPGEQAHVEKLRSTDKGVAAENLGPSVNYKDRFRSRKRVLFKHHRDKMRTRVVLRDGSVLEGEVEWFGKWEFGLRVNEDAVPVIFRHAMHRFEAVGVEGAGAGGKRRKKR